MQRKKRAIKGVLNRMKNLKLSQAWESYQEFYQDKIRLTGVMSRAALRFQKRQLGMGLNTWVGWYEEVKQQQDVLNRSARRWKNRKLSAAYTLGASGIKT